MGQEVSIDLELVVQQMRDLKDVSQRLADVSEKMRSVTERQDHVTWTGESGAVGFAGQFRMTGGNLATTLKTISDNTVKMHDQLERTVDEFIEHDEQMAERYQALVVKYGVKDAAQSIAAVNAALGGAMGGVRAV